MATKGKTRGPKDSKAVKRAAKDDSNFATKRKRTEKQIGLKKK